MGQSHYSCNNAFISFLVPSPPSCDQHGMPCREKACGCSVSDPCPFCQQSQTECTLWTLQGPLRSTRGFAALLVTTVTKKNLEWESGSKSLPSFNGSTAEGAAGHLQGTWEKEKRSKNRRNKNTKTKTTVQSKSILWEIFIYRNQGRRLVITSNDWSNHQQKLQAASHCNKICAAALGGKVSWTCLNPWLSCLFFPRVSTSKFLRNRF